MPRINQFVCDCGCNAVRQPSNHWRMLTINDGDWTISAWKDEWEDRYDVKFLAGQKCAHTMLDMFLSATDPIRFKEEEVCSLAT